MSHRADNIPPYIISYVPNIFTDAGHQSFTIAVDNNVSLTSKLEIPAAFGTVIGDPVFSRTSATQTNLTYTIDVQPTGSGPVVYTLNLSHAGASAVGNTLSITHGGWTPAALVTGVNDGFWIASDLDASHVNGDPVTSWPAKAGLLQPLTSSIGNQQPVYRDGTVTGINSKSVVQFLSAGYKKLYPNPAEWAGTNAAGFTIAILQQWPTQGGGNSNNNFSYYTGNGQYLHTHGGTSTTRWRWHLYDANSYSRVYAQYGSDQTVWQVIYQSDNTSIQTLHDGITSRGSYTGVATTPTTPQISTSNTSYGGGDTTGGLLIAEIIYLDRVLSSQEKTDLTDYWTANYGV